MTKKRGLNAMSRRDLGLLVQGFSLSLTGFTLFLAYQLMKGTQTMFAADVAMIFNVTLVVSSVLEVLRIVGLIRNPMKDSQDNVIAGLFAGLSLALNAVALGLINISLGIGLTLIGTYVFWTRLLDLGLETYQFFRFRR